MKIEQIVTTSDNKKFKGDDAVARAQAHEAGLKVGPLVNAWLDKIGATRGKHGRRKVSSALIARWEADRDSGVLAELEAELEAESAEVTPEPEAVEAVA